MSLEKILLWKNHAINNISQLPKRYQKHLENIREMRIYDREMVYENLLLMRNDELKESNKAADQDHIYKFLEAKYTHAKRQIQHIANVIGEINRSKCKPQIGRYA